MKKINNLLFYSLISGTLMLNADITGVVFEELPVNGAKVNNYGLKDSNEKGLKGIKVVAVDENGKKVESITKDDGSYTLKGLSGDVRLEFKDIPKYLKESFTGKDAKSSVRFIKDGDSVNLALHNPANFANSVNPEVVATLFVNGAASGGNSASQGTIVSWSYRSNTEAKDLDKHVLMENTGGVWGLAYDRARDNLYSSAVVRRHVGLGSGGVGAIYLSHGYRAGAVDTSLWLDISKNLGVDLGSVNRNSDKEYNIPSNYTGLSYDIDAYKNVARVGLGDIDLSEDGEYLYAMDLKNKAVLKISTKDKTLKDTLAIEDPGCSDGDYRPWGIGVHNNSIYVGVVCSAEASQKSEDLKAYVLKWDGNEFSTVVNFPLNFKRQTAVTGKSAIWHPWEKGTAWHNDTYAQPILSDIAFDETGAMILGFLDRYSFMTGNNNYTTDTSSKSKSEGHSGGDILRACLDSNGEYKIENNGNCGSIATKGKNTNSGPGGGEYYTGDAALKDDGGAKYKHFETATGSLVVLPGSAEVMTSVFDPITKDSAGVARLSYKNGASNRNKKELHGDEGGPGPHFGKAGGVGDIELIMAPAPIEIGNRVWYDENSNGIQDANEKGMEGVKVELYCNSKKLGDATTDANGEYYFGGVSNLNLIKGKTIPYSSDCKVRVSLSDAKLKDLRVTKQNYGNNDNIDSDGDNGKVDNGYSTIIFKSGNMGENDYSLDFGFSDNMICLGDRVWYDDNYNGIQDKGEVGVGKVKVKLLDKSGKVIKNTETNSKGEYQFCELEPGSYSVQFDKATLPSGTVFTKKDKGNSDALDSDADTKTGKTKSVTLKLGDDYKDLDAGVFVPACIGNRVWFDKNKDGIQDTNEVGIAKIKVKLFNKSGEVTKDAFGNTLMSETNSTGGYEFCNLIPGDYHVEVDSGNYLISPKDAGKDDSKDSDIDKDGKMATTKLDRDEKDLTWDAGLYTETCVGDFVWNDKNVNGIQDAGEEGIKNVKIDLVDANGTVVGSATTDSSGKYQICTQKAGTYKIKFDITTLPKGYVPTKQTTGTSDGSDADRTTGIVDSVKLEYNKINNNIDMGAYKTVCLGDFVWYDKNTNGLQDKDEKGIDGVVAHLIKDGKDTGKKVTTANGGKYQFCDLAPGKYKVKFDTTDNYLVTTKDSGDDKKDSDIDSKTKTTDEVTLTNSSNFTVDAGLYFKPSCLGDTIWEDTNGNGKLDSGESGIKGVTVHLLDKDGKEIATKVTDDKGEYKFCQLQPGEYKIKVDKPDGFNPTVPTTKDGEDGDSDLNDNGESKPIDLPSNTNDTTWDGGFFKPSCLGDFVWNDKNANGVQDKGEEPISGATIKLLDSNGKELNSTTTDSDGKYSFCELAPGSYSIEVVKPDGYTLTKPNTTDDTKDSDIDRKTAKSEVIVLKSGVDYKDLDAGLVEPGCIASVVWLDEDRDGVQGSDEKPLEGIKVTLLDKDGKPAVDADGNAIDTIETNANGEYKFCNLMPDDYRVKFESEKYITTTKNDGADRGSDVDSNQNSATSDIVKVEAASKSNPQVVYAGFIEEICLGDFVWYDENLNGIKDKDEPGVVDVKVALLYADGTKALDVNGNPIEPTKTGKDGKYKFCHVKPGVDYKIKFTIPDTYHTTLQNRGKDDAKDSDTDELGVIDVIKPMKSDMSLDMGIYCDCDDYKVNSDGKSDSASALNFGGFVAMFLFTIAAIRRGKRA